MQHIQGISRNQLQMGSLEDKITSDNPVRFIDAFVGLIDLKKIGFEPRVLKTEGRPSFKTEVFLKLYLYGYLNDIRSSRKLERETKNEYQKTNTLPTPPTPSQTCLYPNTGLPMLSQTVSVILNCPLYELDRLNIQSSFP